MRAHIAQEGAHHGSQRAQVEKVLRKIEGKPVADDDKGSDCNQIKNKGVYTLALKPDVNSQINVMLKNWQTCLPNPDQLMLFRIFM